MSNQVLGPYSIGERVGGQVWLAEDTRSGKTVAIKLLSRQLPKDASRRESLIRDVRVSSALYHTFLVPILEIAEVGDNLLMVMERVEGQCLTKRMQGGTPLDRTEMLRISYQLVDVIKYLHVKGILHGNVNGDSVLITPAGQVKLGGLNPGNLLRRDGPSTAYQQKGSDARAVAYMAPEQITGQSIVERTDIYSAGVAMYELATGRLPFSGATAAEVARAIVEGSPASPKAANPALEPAVMVLLGGCLFKDPFKRVKDAKQLLEQIAKVDPDVVTFAQQFEKKVLTANAGGAAESRRSILLVADVAGDDPKAAARMQQILGESVYLFDGKVIDPFSTRLVAELPNVDAALEAGRKGEFDFSPGQQGEEPLDVRMLLHAGELETRDGAAGGAAVERALEVLPLLTPNTLFISEEFVKEGRGNVRLRDAGARGGVKLFNIVPAEPPQVELPEPTTLELAEEEAAEQAALVAEITAGRRARRRRSLALAALGLLIFLGSLGVMWFRRERAEPVQTAAAAQTAKGPAPASAANPRKVLIADVSAEDPALAEQANAVRLGAIEVLRSFPELRIAELSAPDVTSVSARLRNGAAGPELVPSSGAPVAMPDVATGVAALVQWTTEQVQMPPRTIAAAAAVNPFADAVVARSKNDAARAEASLRSAIAADPTFLPAQMMAMQFFESRGNSADAIAAARQVVVLDPSNLEAMRKVARASLASGDLHQAFAMYGALLQREPGNAEALNLVARYSLGAGDTARFNATLAKLRPAPASTIQSHEPDVLAYAGRLDAATQRYYDVETNIQNNPTLSLKIGRLAVLRHSLEIAQIELEKLEQLDPLYGRNLLEAYIAAEKRDRRTADAELKEAMQAASPGDDSWTSAAEVYAILADTTAVLDSLEKAALRKEPTGAYVLANPLFRYLASDARFTKIREQFVAQQAEARSALMQVR